MKIIYALIGIFTAIMGYAINHSIIWAILDWFFWPCAWVKWIICHQISISLIKQMFSFFLS